MDIQFATLSQHLNAQIAQPARNGAGGKAPGRHHQRAAGSSALRQASHPHQVSEAPNSNTHARPPVNKKENGTKGVKQIQINKNYVNIYGTK